jgi:DNA topoisomerase-1
MPKQFCYDLKVPDNVKVDIANLKKFITKLYVGKSIIKFDSAEDTPFFVVYSITDNSMCITMTSISAKNLERIAAIHKALKPPNLKFGDIILAQPYLFSAETKSWWDTGLNIVPYGNKWNSIVQRGPYFPGLMEPYKPLGAFLIYDGIKYPLNPKEEQVSGFFAVKMTSEESGTASTEDTTDPVFTGNYWTDFKKYLTPEHKLIFKYFNKADWSDIQNKQKARKERKLTLEEKLEKKIASNEINFEYNYALLDGSKEKVANFRVEPAGLFKGRGKHPLRGHIKVEATPEDVTLNIGPNDPIPKAPAGHKWGNIVNKQDVEWLSSWKEIITNSQKNTRFAEGGKFSGMSEFQKYESARKLEANIDTVRKIYMLKAHSGNLMDRQLGTILYLIDNFGIRMGGERSDKQAKTYGISTIESRHLELKEPDSVNLDFLGKDSVRYNKTLKLPADIYKNLQIIERGKTNSDRIFDKLTPTIINTFLQTIDKSFKAKLFRTRLASTIMYEELPKVKIPQKATKQQTKTAFGKANVKVAEVLNHSRSLTTKQKEVIQKRQDQLKKLKNEYKKSKNPKLKKDIEKMEEKVEQDNDTKNVALNTSLKSYIDPRLIVSWIKRKNINMSYIYSETLQTRYNWAIDTTESDWDYMTHPYTSNLKINLEPKINNKPPTRPNKPKINNKPPPRLNKPKINNKPPNKPSTKPPRPVTKPPRPVTKPPRPVTKPPKPVTKPPKPVWEGPGTIEDYEYILRFCNNATFKNAELLMFVPENVMKWVYMFSKYALEKQLNPRINKFLVSYYEQKRK